MWTVLAAAVSVAVPALVGGPVIITPRPPTVYGYVWASQPAEETYVADTGYEFNSTGGSVEVTRVGAGDYVVRFTGMSSGGARGVAHAAAYGSANNGYCTVVDYAPSGADQEVLVRCFGAGGAPADMRFVADFTNVHQPISDVSYLWANEPAAPAPYEPPATHRYDSSGQVATVERYATGSYVVISAAVDGTVPDHLDGHFQVTARSGAARHCEAHGGQDESPLPVPVFCRDADGDLVDSEFTFTYTRGVDLLAAGLSGGTARLRPHNVTLVPYLEGWWNPGGEPTVTRTAVGRYQVRFPGLAAPRGHAIVHGSGSSAQHYCTVRSWYAVGADEAVNVDCFDTATNLPADSIASVSFVDGGP
jgi:hypothetical protein